MIIQGLSSPQLPSFSEISASNGLTAARRRVYYQHDEVTRSSGSPQKGISVEKQVRKRNDMAKRRMSLRVRVPAYKHPRNAWRELIHSEVVKVANARGVSYKPDDKLELIITLYLNDTGLRFHDVDNRLKDIMDALQGRAGGPKSKRCLSPIIPNDHQVFRVFIEKMLLPGQSHGMGHLVIRKYKALPNQAVHRIAKDRASLASGKR